jgi:hypothetical protein|tara:strand:- start:1467 stop:2147 length:681 start_codon:yes stop_codon:yes gene_type:complete
MPNNDSFLYTHDPSSLKFTTADFIQSDTANRLKIDNTPGVDYKKSYSLSKEHVEENMRMLFKKCVHPIKLQFPNLAISSGYRCMELNTSLIPPGTTYSNHVYGQAVDLYDPTGEFSSQEIFTWALYNIHDYHQMILEWPEMGKSKILKNGEHKVNSWVHIAIKKDTKGQVKTTLASSLDAYHNKYKNHHTWRPVSSKTQKPGSYTHGLVPLQFGALVMPVIPVNPI